METIKKYLIAFDNEPPFELPVDSLDEARAEVKRNFSAYDEVRLLEVMYQSACVTPHIIRTKEAE